MNKIDIYAEISKYCSALEMSGFAAEACQLKSAIAEGATGTEILMALRFHLKKIVERASLEERSDESAAWLLSEINAALDS